MQSMTSVFLPRRRPGLYILGLVPTHQQYVKSGLLEGIEQRLPITAGTFHGDGGHPMLAQMADHLLVVFGIHTEFAHIVFGLVDGHEMAARAHVDSGRMGMDNFERSLIAFHKTLVVNDFRERIGIVRVFCTGFAEAITNQFTKCLALPRHRTLQPRF